MRDIPGEISPIWVNFHERILELPPPGPDTSPGWLSEHCYVGQLHAIQQLLPAAVAGGISHAIASVISSPFKVMMDFQEGRL